MRRSAANLLLLTAGAIWGMGFVAQSTAMDHVDPLVFVASRFTIASLVLTPFALVETRRHAGGLDAGIFWKFALIGAAMFGGMATQQVGLLTTSVSNSGFLTGLYVVFTPLLVVLVFRELPHPVIWPGAGLALLGIFLLSGGNFAALTVGDLLTILGALFWAAQVMLIARYVGSTGRPLLLAAVQFYTVALLACVGVVIAGESVQLGTLLAAGPELLYTGVFAGGLAFTLQIIAQRYTTASQAVIFLSSEAPFAALFGALFLGERIGWVALTGCLAILVAMLLVELVPSQN